MRNVMAEVTYNMGPSKVLYGPFSDMEYVDFKEFLLSVMNPTWTVSIEPVRINSKVTEWFFTHQAAKEGVRV